MPVIVTCTMFLISEWVSHRPGLCFANFTRCILKFRSTTGLHHKLIEVARLKSSQNSHISFGRVVSPYMNFIGFCDDPETCLLFLSQHLHGRETLEIPLFGVRGTFKELHVNHLGSVVSPTGLFQEEHVIVGDLFITFAYFIWYFRVEFKNRYSRMWQILVVYV